MYTKWLALAEVCALPVNLVTGRIAAKQQPAGIVFTHTGQKSGFSPRMGDSLHRFRSNFAEPTGTWVRLAEQNFTSIGAEGGNAAPQKLKMYTFW